MSRALVFSADCGGINRARRHHLGVVGKVLGKEMGKDFCCPFSSIVRLIRLRLCARSESRDKSSKSPPIFHAADLAVINKGDMAEALGSDSASAPRNIQVVSLDLHIITV